MKYTSIVVIAIGFLIACFTAARYASGVGGLPGQPAEHSIASLVIPLGFATAMVCLGAAMLAFGGKGYTITRPRFFRRPPGEFKDRVDTRKTK